MTDITYSMFSGSIPRLAPHLIKPGMAQLALDCKLHSGQLESWREPLLVQQVPPDTQSAIQKDCCGWEFYPGCVDVAYGPTTCNKFYMTGAQDRPTETWSEEGDCQFKTRWLGLPCPTEPPTVTHSGSIAGGAEDTDLEGRAYAYQYVSETGAVSALSKPAWVKEAKDGEMYAVIIPAIPTGNWGISGIRIYRTVSGDSYGKDAGHKVDTTWMLVDEISTFNLAYSDHFYNEELFEALVEDDVRPPPVNLTGMVWIESMNTLAGFVGNKLYFSENNNYNNWPYEMTLDDNIRGIVESNGAIYVATDGRPYVVEGAEDCENAGCRNAIRLPYPVPMVAYGSAHIAGTALGAVYPSFKGLVLLSGNAKPTFLTWPWYSEEDWQEMQPETAVPVEFDGKLYCFLNNGAFALTLPQGPEAGWANDGHTDLSDRGVVDAFVTRQGQFLILKEDGLYEWNRGDTLRPHKWVSGEFVAPTPYCFGAGHIFFRNGPEHVKIEVDQHTALDRDVLSNRVYRLPMWACGTRWTFTLSGTGQVSLLSTAASMQDLGR